MFNLPRPEQPRAKRRPSDIVALIGFIVVGVIIIWGIVHAAQLASPWFSSLFSQKTATVEVATPDSATSGTPFTVSWKYTPTVNGHYAFLFPCQSGLLFKTAAAGGGDTNVPCGASFSIPDNNKTITLTPSVATPTTGVTSIKVPLSIVYIPANGSAHVSGTHVVTINSAPVVTPKVGPAPTTTHVNPVQTGPADLSVRILNINADPYGNGMIEFDIANNGGSSTGVWYFQVSLPTNTGYTYFSPPQKSLAPGDHIVNTLQFSQISQYGGIISVQVDPANMVPETNKGNNYASQQVGIAYPSQQYTH